jgi:hypothetical protein
MILDDAYISPIVQPDGLNTLHVTGEQREQAFKDDGVSLDQSEKQKCAESRPSCRYLGRPDKTGFTEQQRC